MQHSPTFLSISLPLSLSLSHRERERERERETCTHTHTHTHTSEECGEVERRGVTPSTTGFDHGYLHTNSPFALPSDGARVSETEDTRALERERANQRASERDRERARARERGRVREIERERESLLGPTPKLSRIQRIHM